MTSRERGSATLEFVGVAIALVVPLTYAMLAMAQLQSAVYGVEGAAQMASRAYVNATSDLVGRYAAVRSAAIAGRNHGLFITSDDVTISCASSVCLEPGTAVHLAVRTSVRIGAAGFTRTMRLQATRDFVVDAFRASPL